MKRPDLNESVAPPNMTSNEAGKSTTLDRAQARLVRNVWSNYLGYIVTILVAFLVSPVLVHKLGDAAYGVWALVQQLVGYTVLLDFGIRIAVTRYLAQHHAKDEIDRINHTLSTACVVALIPATIILAGGAAVAYFFPRIFMVPAQLIYASRIAVLLLAVSMAVSGPGSLFTACVAAVSRYDLLTVRNISFAVLRGLCIWIFLSLGYGLVTVALISLFAALFGFGMDIYFAFSEMPGLRLRLRFYDRSTLHELLRFSFYVFLTSIAVRLVYWSDNIVVGAMLGTAAVTYYAIGGTLVQYLRDGMDNFTRVFGPMAAQMDALGRRESLQRLLIKGTRISSLFVVPGVVGFILVGPAFLSLWMGSPYSQKSTPVLLILSVSVLFLPFAAIYSHVLYAMNCHKVSGWFAIFEGTTNFALSVLFAQRFGIAGVALGTLIPAVINQGVIMPLYTARLVDVPIAKYYGWGLLQPILISPPMIAFLWFARAQGFLQSWLPLIASAIIASVIYLASAWLLAFDQEERRYAFHFIAKLGILPDSWMAAEKEIG